MFPCRPVPAKWPTVSVELWRTNRLWQRNWIHKRCSSGRTPKSSWCAIWTRLLSATASLASKRSAANVWKRLDVTWRLLSWRKHQSHPSLLPRGWTCVHVARIESHRRDFQGVLFFFRKQRRDHRIGSQTVKHRSHFASVGRRKSAAFARLISIRSTMITALPSWRNLPFRFRNAEASTGSTDGLQCSEVIPASSWAAVSTSSNIRSDSSGNNIGAYAKINVANADGRHLVLKVQEADGFWEFYIMSKWHRRLADTPVVVFTF